MILFDRKRGALGAYTLADTSPKVGFRPYGQTDPTGAANLSGLGTYHLNRPFDPWELYADIHDTAGVRSGLHGLGQNHPFKETAWKLHGLGVDILPATAQAQLDDLAQQLKQAQDDIVAAGQQIVSAMQAGNDMSAEGQALHSQQDDLNTMINALTYVYRTFTGTVPPLLSGYSQQPTGLGVIPAIPLGTAAVTIAAIVAALAAWWIYEQTLKDHIKQKLADTANIQAQTQQIDCTGLQARLAQAQQSGDTVTAQTILSLMADQCGTLNPAESDTSSWLSSYGLWLGLGAFALLYVIPPGGRRR